MSMSTLPIASVPYLASPQPSSMSMHSTVMGSSLTSTHHHTASAGQVELGKSTSDLAAHPTVTDSDKLNTFASVQGTPLTACSLRRLSHPAGRSASVPELSHHTPIERTPLPPLTKTSQEGAGAKRTVSFVLTDISSFTSSAATSTVGSVQVGIPEGQDEVEIPQCVTIRREAQNLSSVGSSLDSLVPSPLPPSISGVSSSLAPSIGTPLPTDTNRRPSISPSQPPPRLPDRRLSTQSPSTKTFQPLDRCILAGCEYLEEVEGPCCTLTVPLGAIGRFANETISVAGNILGAGIALTGSLTYLTGSVTAFFPTCWDEGGCTEKNKELAKGRLAVAWDLAKTTGVSVACVAKKVSGIGVLNYFGTRCCPTTTRNVTKSFYRGVGRCVSRPSAPEYGAVPANKTYLREFKASGFKQGVLLMSGAGTFGEDIRKYQQRHQKSIPQGRLPHLPPPEATVLNIDPTGTTTVI